MLQRPAALLSDVGSRLWSIAGSDNSNNVDDNNNSEASNSTGIPHGDSSKSIRQRISQSTLIERLSSSRAHHNNSSSTPSTASHHRDLLHHHGSDINEHIQDITIAPTSHRENTAFHALRDTFVFPSPASLLPALPTIPCMSGLGQSNLFADHGPLSPGRKNNPNLKGAAYDPQHHRYADQHHRGLSMEDEQNDIHHQKAGALFLGSNSKHDSFKKLNNGLNVLMLGGYRGSILRDAASGRRLWVPLKVGFNVRKAELAIDLDDEAEMRTTETVVPGKSLAAIAGFVDLGKRLKDRLKQMDKDGQIHFHGWGYDWRRSLELSSAELVAYLEGAKQETGKPTLVIAHSMGGLVALHALARAEDPTIFKGIIFGSTPFDGTPNILQPFKHGDSILMNKDICSPSTVFSFRSSFYLLPANKTCFYTPHGQKHPVDFLEPSEWIKYGLSPMTVRLGEASARREEARDEATEASGGGTAPITVQQLGESSRSRTSSSSSNNNSSSRTLASGNPIKSASGPVGNHGQEMDVSDQEIMHYLNRTLDNVKKFRQELTSLYDPDKKDNYPPIVLLSSTRTPTVKGCLVNDRQEIIDGKYDRLLFGEGDGIVLNDSATALPQVWKTHQVGHVESGNGHVSILSDLNAIRQAIDLIDANSRL